MILITGGKQAYGFKQNQVKNIYQDGGFIKIWLNNGVVLMVNFPERVTPVLVDDLWKDEEPTVRYHADNLILIFNNL